MRLCSSKLAPLLTRLPFSNEASKALVYNTQAFSSASATDPATTYYQSGTKAYETLTPTHEPATAAFSHEIGNL